MKKSIYPALFVLLLFACKNEPSDKEIIETKKVAAEIPDEDRFDYDTLRGIYKGDFAGSEIRIILNYVSGSNVIGYNIHKGLQRNLNGSVSRSGDTVTMVLEEPGDHEFDGVFTLRFIGIDTAPTGKWEALNTKKVGSQKLKLERVIIDRSDDSPGVPGFVMNYGLLYDTIGHYNFQEDGLCIFEYYPSDLREGASEQKKEITGNWTVIKDSTLRIDWQANKLFKKTENFRLTKYFYDDDDEYYELYLKGEGRELHPMYY